jgi:hypothetical protein
LLVGGDKSQDWTGWYIENIPVADRRFDEHQHGLDAVAPQRSTKRPKGRKR